jgi:hypothetical protein
MSTRRSQPFRQGARVPGAALDAMKRGRSASGSNPQDTVRAFLTAAKKRGQKRPDRPARPERPPRPPR